MARLSDRAFEILSSEFKRLASSPLEQTRRSIVLHRLEKFRLQDGSALGEAEIRTWRFTYDEFEGARKSVGRMEAQVFQETNAQTLLEEGVTEVEAAKQAYATATTLQAEDTALANWQAGMDKLAEIAPETYAGKCPNQTASLRTRLSAGCWRRRWGDSC